MSALPLPSAKRALGASGIEVAPLAWGMWRSVEAGHGAQDVVRLLHAVLDAGMTLVDTADIYGFDGTGGFGGAEELLGEAFRHEPGLRERIVLATKGGISPGVPYDQSRGYMQSALDASLARLGVERVELYQIHRPDILTHPQELARFLEDAVASGKVGAIGVSNFTIHQIETLAALLDTPLATTQPEISATRIEPLVNGEMDQALRLGLTPLAWSPLGGGRIIAPGDARQEAVAKALDNVAQQAGVGRAVAALGWLIAHPVGIVPIVGSQSSERIAEAGKAMAMRWTREDWYKVLVAARGEKLP